MESDEKFAVCFDSNGLKSCRNLFVRKGKSNFLLLPEGVADEKNFNATIEVSRKTFRGKFSDFDICVVVTVFRSFFWS